jgi:hypothetical protein
MKKINPNVEKCLYLFLQECILQKTIVSQEYFKGL